MSAWVPTTQDLAEMLEDESLRRRLSGGKRRRKKKSSGKKKKKKSSRKKCKHGKLKSPSKGRRCKKKKSSGRKKKKSSGRRKLSGGKVQTRSQAKTTAGIRRAVWEGRLRSTKGGLTKKDLKVSKSGKIVSKKASAAAKKRLQQNPHLAMKFKQQQNLMRGGQIRRN